MNPGVTEDTIFEPLWGRVEQATMMSRERAYALYQAVNYIIDNKIPGSFVACGIWRGGPAMLIALTLLHRGVTWRDIVLFDTFTEVTDETADREDPSKTDMEAVVRSAKRQPHGSLAWTMASEDEARTNIESCGYDPRRIRLVNGGAHKTLPLVQTGRIALLRLDLDLHDSTLVELETLYPRLERGGVLLVDDYGTWDECRTAVDGYLHGDAVQTIPLLQRIDSAGRLAIKLDPSTNLDIDRYDYRPPGFSGPDMFGLFDNLIIDDPRTVSWDYLRSAVPHIWRRDGNFLGDMKIGLLSAEEALLIYELAHQFSGKRGLEIGCHFGWSTVHAVAAGIHLDVIDPRLGDPDQHRHVQRVLDKVESPGSYRLWAGFSPSITEAVFHTAPEPWSFVFIDGDHSSPAPLNDALSVEPFLADDALIVFHDLNAPDVSQGIRALKDRGWSVRLFNTMQIMGAAWRGNVNIPDHVPDPNMPGRYPEHLSGLDD